MLKRFRTRYESIVEELAPLINSVASYVPPRRARKLHIGLFGYSRSVRGIVLPRAIPFAAACYSLGIPPEFIGGKVLGDLEENEWDLLQKGYVNMKNDLVTVGAYLSWQNINMLVDMHEKVAERASMRRHGLEAALSSLSEDLKTIEGNLSVKLGPRNSAQRKHENFTNNFLLSYMEREESETMTSLLEAAKIRKCLG